MKRDILNYLGETVGELELPDDTHENVWVDKLAIYAKAPSVEPIKDVTPRQIRQALVLSGVTLSAIDAALSQLPEPTQSMAKIEWEYSVAFQRNRPVVAAIGQLLGWSTSKIDTLWTLAGSL